MKTDGIPVALALASCPCLGRKIWSMTSAPVVITGRSSRNGTVGYWNFLNAPPGERSPATASPFLLGAPLRRPAARVALLPGASCTRRDRPEDLPGQAAAASVSGTLFRHCCDLLTCGFSPG
jgi:hypothetical protein